VWASQSLQGSDWVGLNEILSLELNQLAHISSSQLLRLTNIKKVTNPHYREISKHLQCLLTAFVIIDNATPYSGRDISLALFSSTTFRMKKHGRQHGAELNFTFGI
jgi:hypothetical protein